MQKVRLTVEELATLMDKMQAGDDEVREDQQTVVSAFMAYVSTPNVNEWKSRGTVVLTFSDTFINRHSLKTIRT